MIFSLLLILVSCQEQQSKSKVTADNSFTEPDLLLPIQSIKDIKPPDGYKRMSADPASFAYWLRNVPLKKETAVYLYNGKLKPNQSAQFAVVDISVGKRTCSNVLMW